MATTATRPASTARSVRADRRAIVAWSSVAAVGIVIGGHHTARHPGLHTNASPFHGRWMLDAAPWITLAVGVGALVIAFGPALCDRLRWTRLVVATPAAALTWTVTLCVSSGLHAFTAPLTTRYDYLAGVPFVRGARPFLRHFTTLLPSLPTHVKGHPPGLVLVLWLLDRLGLGAPVWAAMFVVAVGASAAAAVLLAVREVAGEATARKVAPFVVLMPGAVWLATSGDAFFTGIGAWAVAATVLATANGRRRWSILAGGLWAVALLSSYGLVLLAPVAMAAALSRRRLDVLLATGATAILALVLVGSATGFWWPEGLAATRRAYTQGFAATRSPWVFVWLNVTAVAIAAGPALAPALRRARGPAAVLAFGAMAGLVVADLSLLSKGEVERIWLPWLPWLAVATAALPTAGRRAWLSSQAATAVGLQLALRSPW